MILRSVFWILLSVSTATAAQAGEPLSVWSLSLDAPAGATGLALPGTYGLGLQAEPAAEGPGGGDWKGLRQDTGYFMVYQFAVIAALYVSPEGVSRWSAEDKQNFSLEKYRSNIRHVVWDKDDLFINYVLHPYWGATYFVRARERGFGNTGSFWYATLLSTIYEFGAEALFEKPSIQDLFFTPGLGAVVGKYFMNVRAGIQDKSAAGLPLTGMDKTKLVLTDPLGALNRKVNRLLGKDIELQVQPFVAIDGAAEADAAPLARLSRVPTVRRGLRFQLRW